MGFRATTRLTHRFLAVLLVLGASSCGRSERSSVTRPAVRSTPASSAGSADVTDSARRSRRPPGPRTPVIWIGLDGLDCRARGSPRPRKAGCRTGSASRRRVTRRSSKSFMPILSPVVWTTLATGVGPDVHRLLDFQEVDPATGQKVPISGRSRAVPAIWNVASANGLSVGVVGWWATHPAEEVKGFFVSDHASPILFRGLPRRASAYPESLAAAVERVVARTAGLRRGAHRVRRMSPADIAPGARPGGDLGSGGGARPHDRRDAGDRASRARALRPEPPGSHDGVLRGHRRHRPSLRRRRRRRGCVHDRRGFRAVSAGPSTTTSRSSTACSDSGCAGRRKTARRSSSTPTTGSSGAPTARASTGRSIRRRPASGIASTASSPRGARASDRGGNGRAQRLRRRADGLGAARPPVDRRARGEPIRGAFRDLATPPRADLVDDRAGPTARGRALSEKEASDYAKKLIALGYLSGGEPGRLSPSGGDRPGLTESRVEQPRPLSIGVAGKTDDARGGERVPRRRSSSIPATRRRCTTSRPCSSAGAARTGRPSRGSSGPSRPAPGSGRDRARLVLQYEHQKRPGQARDVLGTGARRIRRARRSSAGVRPRLLLAGEGLSAGRSAALAFRDADARAPRP